MVSPCSENVRARYDDLLAELGYLTAGAFLFAGDASSLTSMTLPLGQSRNPLSLFALCANMRTRAKE